MSSCVSQNCKRQDVTWIGNVQGTYCVFAADGHGTDVVVRWLKYKPEQWWRSCFEQSNPLESIEKELKASQLNTEGSGACVVAQTLSPEGKVKMWNMGDTQGLLFVNGELKAKTVTHTPENPSEIKRKLNEYPELSFDRLFSSEQMIKFLPSANGLPSATTGLNYRCNHAPFQSINAMDNQLQPSRSIGHKNRTGNVCDYQEWQLGPQDQAVLITGSDGVWDPYTFDTNDLCQFAIDGGATKVVRSSSERWVGDWNFYHPWMHEVNQRNNKKKCFPCIEQRSRFGWRKLKSLLMDQTLVPLVLSTVAKPVLSTQPGIPPDDICATCIVVG